jgi:lysophospholipase L1-like esterase
MLEGRTVPSGVGPDVAAAVAIAAAAVGDPTSLAPVERPDTLAIHAGFTELADSGGASDVVLYGDSITDIYGKTLVRSVANWGPSLAPFRVVDFGVGGDYLENLLWRLENGELDGQPRVAVVMIGTNNIYLDSPATVASGIGTIVGTIRTLSPRTQVVLLDLLPRGAPDDPARSAIAQVNAVIAGLDDGAWVHVLDLGGLFLLPDGSISPDLMASDFLLHPTDKGSQLIADALLAPIDALHGSPAPDPKLYDWPALVNVPTNPVEQASLAGTAALLAPQVTAVDAVDPAPTVSFDPPIGTPLPIGTAVVTCRATNQYGNTVSQTFTVTVRQYIPPVFQYLPGNQVLEATSTAGAVAAYLAPVATGGTNALLGVSTSIPSGSTFPLGTTRVVCTATDRAGVAVQGSFYVTVNDSPVLHDNNPAAIMVEARGPSGAVVTYLPPTASSAADSDLPVDSSMASGSTFPIGTTLVTFTARGLTGLSTSTSFTVTVIPQVRLASVTQLVNLAFNRALVPSTRLLTTVARPGRRASALLYSPVDPRHNVTNPDAVAFLSRVDSNHDFRVSRNELSRFLSVNVDLNHDGAISLYEEAVLKLDDPVSARYLFPGL